MALSQGGEVVQSLDEVWWDYILVMYRDHVVWEEPEEILRMDGQTARLTRVKKK